MKIKRVLTVFLLIALFSLTSCSLNDRFYINNKDEEPIVQNEQTILPTETDPVQNPDNTEVDIESLNLGYSDTYTPVSEQLLNPNQWYLQYPSGLLADGSSYMCGSPIGNQFANKYFSAQDDWVKFSLDAQDRGKSANGSSVRSELHSTDIPYYLSGQDKITGEIHKGDSAEFSYTFKVNCTQLDIATFTVGQVMFYGGYDHANNKQIPDKPVIMIMCKEGELIFAFKYYSRSYTTGEFNKFPNEQNMNHIEIPLGKITNLMEVSIKVILNDRDITLYRDNELMVSTSFLPQQDSMDGMYFKLGLYYQTKETDERIKYLFTDVYIKDIFLKIS